MIEQKIKALLPASLPTYIGDLPSTPSDVISIVLFDGANTLEYFGEGTVYQPVVKIVVRNKSYGEAQQWNESVKQSLHRHTDDYFMSILMQGYPV